MTNAINTKSRHIGWHCPGCEAGRTLPGESHPQCAVNPRIPDGWLAFGEPELNSSGWELEIVADDNKDRQVDEVAQEMLDLEEMSTAEQISLRFGDDGMRWSSADGTRLVDVLASAAARTEQDWDNGQSKTIFADGSAIVCAGEAWDIALDADDDRCFCWAGLETHDDACPVSSNSRDARACAVAQEMLDRDESAREWDGLVATWASGTIRAEDLASDWRDGDIRAIADAALDDDDVFAIRSRYCELASLALDLAVDALDAEDEVTS